MNDNGLFILKIMLAHIQLGFKVNAWTLFFNSNNIGFFW